ncbi:MAG TPA: GNAT family N-acetyltransferase [Tepidisphaeraceae bacterium]|jgi:RimJ/RimL family protein N-acetyltransferase|nr:GNAT family N-acetyltransferase [Tepidisphaeraceae bacterium]
MAAPILLDVPESFETERLLIRVPCAGDGAQVNAAVLETFDDLHAWMPWAAERPTVEQTEEYCRKSYSQFIAREDITLRLIHKQSGLFLGSSGLHPRGWDVRAFEIGYWCRKRFEGQGYITEAVRGILQFGFERLNARRIEVRCDSRNLRSIRVAECVGLKREGELRNHVLAPDGSLRNTVIFALTDDDWKSHLNHGLRG